MSALSVSNNNNTESRSLLPFNVDLFENLQSLIDKGDIKNAVEDLLCYLSLTHLFEEKEKLYSFIKQILPKLDSEQWPRFYERLQKLLDVTQNDQKHQSELAFDFAEYCFTKASLENGLSEKIIHWTEAMHYYAKAIRMDYIRNDPIRLKNWHKQASKIFLLLIKERLVKKNQFETFLHQACIDEKPGFVKGLIQQIEELKRFCMDEKDQSTVIENLYSQAIRASNQLKQDKYIHSLERYNASFIPILRNMGKLFLLPEKLCTERYKEGIDAFRSYYEHLPLSHEEMRKFQKEITEKIDAFLSTLIKDVLAILGPPPCDFDFRACGSVAREEMCPFSDLEYMVIIQKTNEKIRKYFAFFIQVLKLQIVSLGEDDGFTMQFAFTCLYPPRMVGFHLDEAPDEFGGRISMPANLASFQNQLDGPNSSRHFALKTRSLYATPNSTLYKQYQDELQKIIDASQEHPLKKRAKHHLGTRSSDYKKIWGSTTASQLSSFDLKKAYGEPLFHLLGDIALYHGIKTINTLEIIDAFDKRKFFTKSNIELLRKAVSFIYQLRAKLHLYYKQQKEEICVKPEMAEHGIYIAKKEESEELEKIFWLILYPLYNSKDNIFKLHEKDLVQQAFEQSTEDPHLKKNPKLLVPLINHLVKHLEEEKAFLDIPYYYKLPAISQEEILRTTYIDALQVDVIRNELAKIANHEGKRQQYRLDYEQLHRSIEAITVESKPQEDAVKVVIPYSNQTRYLHPEVAGQILNKGRIKSSYSNSLHRVAPLEWGEHSLHLKELPSNPLMEFAIHNLLSRIAGEVSAPTELVRFEGDGIKPYPVLISKTIPGKTLSERSSTLKFSDLDGKQWTWLVLCSLLIKAGDGRLSNYIVDEKGNIFSIDNDVAFVEPVIREGVLATKINFSSVLFLLSESKDFLNDKVLTEFLTLDHDLILASWIDDVIEKEKQYKDLFSEEERKDLYVIDKQGKKESFTSTILFAPGAMITLRLQWQHLKRHIENRLSLRDNKIPALELLKQIITFHKGATLDHSVGEQIYRTYFYCFNFPLENRLDRATSRRGQGSMTLAESQKASLGKIPTKEELESGKFSPELAKKELLAAINDYSDYFTLTDDSLTVNFRYLRTANGPDLVRQDFYLKNFLNKGSFQRRIIRLRYCDVLNEWNILNFLHRNLEIIELDNISSMNGKILTQIQNRSPDLKEFYLNGLPLSIIGKKPLLFPKLKILSITNCPQLRSVKFGFIREAMYCWETFNVKEKVAPSSPKRNHSESSDSDDEEIKRVPPGLWTKFVREKIYGWRSSKSNDEYFSDEEYSCYEKKVFSHYEKLPQLEKIDLSNNPSLMKCEIPLWKNDHYFEKEYPFPSFDVKDSPWIDLSHYDPKKIFSENDCFKKLGVYFQKESLKKVKDCFEQLCSMYEKKPPLPLGIAEEEQEIFKKRYEKIRFITYIKLGWIYGRLHGLIASEKTKKDSERLEKWSTEYNYHSKKLESYEQALNILIPTLPEIDEDEVHKMSKSFKEDLKEKYEEAIELIQFCYTLDHKYAELHGKLNQQLGKLTY